MTEKYLSESGLIKVLQHIKSEVQAKVGTATYETSQKLEGKVLFNEETSRNETPYILDTNSRTSETYKDSTYVTVDEIRGETVMWNHQKLTPGEYCSDVDGYNDHGIQMQVLEDGRIHIWGTWDGSNANFPLYENKHNSSTAVYSWPLSKYIGNLWDSWGALYLKPPKDTFIDITVNLYMTDVDGLLGWGNSPESYEAFEKWIPENLDSYPGTYRGEARNFLPERIETSNYISLDGLLEEGAYNNDGEKEDGGGDNVRSIDFIDVKPDTLYYFTNIYGADTGYFHFLGYDNDGKVVDNRTNGNFHRTNSNCTKLKLEFLTDKMPTDSLTGWYMHSGETKGETSLDLSWIKKYFPEGMRRVKSSVGDVYDRVFYDVVAHRWIAEKANIQEITFNDLVIETDESNENYLYLYTSSNPILEGVKNMRILNTNLKYIAPGTFIESNYVRLLTDGVFEIQVGGRPVESFLAQFGSTKILLEVPGVLTRVDVTDYVSMYFPIWKNGTERLICAENSSLGYILGNEAYNAVQNINTVDKGLQDAFKKINDFTGEGIEEKLKDYLPLAGGEMLGDVATKNITATETNKYNIGSADVVYATVHATTFKGTADKALVADKIGEVTATALADHITAVNDSITSLNTSLTGINDTITGINDSKLDKTSIIETKEIENLINGIINGTV